MQIELENLRSLIGLGVVYRGIACAVVEVLEDGPALVLEDLGANRSLQDNQYGEPRRQVPETYTLPVVMPSGELNTEFLQLEVRR